MPSSVRRRGPGTSGRRIPHRPAGRKRRSGAPRRASAHWRPAGPHGLPDSRRRSTGRRGPRAAPHRPAARSPLARRRRDRALPGCRDNRNGTPHPGRCPAAPAGDWSIFRPNGDASAKKPSAENMDLSPLAAQDVGMDRQKCSPAPKAIACRCIGRRRRPADPRFDHPARFDRRRPTPSAALAASAGPRAARRPPAAAAWRRPSPRPARPRAAACPLGWQSRRQGGPPARTGRIP